MRFRDFVPKITGTTGSVWLSNRRPEFESFNAAAEAAGEWIKKHGVAPLQIETVVLSSAIHSEHEEGTVDGELPTGALHQFVRIWYDDELRKPPPYRS